MHTKNSVLAVQGTSKVVKDAVYCQANPLLVASYAKLMTHST